MINWLEVVLSTSLFLFHHSILTHYMDDFRDQAKLVPVHLPSRFSKEMASKSEVVSTTILWSFVLIHSGYNYTMSL